MNRSSVRFRQAAPTSIRHLGRHGRSRLRLVPDTYAVDTRTLPAVRPLPSPELSLPGDSGLGERLLANLPNFGTPTSDNQVMDAMEPAVVMHPSGLTVPPEPTEPSELSDVRDRGAAEWPWDTLRAEQEAREGSFTDTMRHDFHWDEESFARLEEAMRAACESLEGQTTIERWVGEGFWCWTAVIPELTEHPRFTTSDPHYLRQCP